MFGDAQLLERLLADKLRIWFDLGLRDLHDLFSNKLGQLISALAREFKFATRALVSFYHHPDFVRIERRVFKQAVDRHSTPV